MHAKQAIARQYAPSYLVAENPNNLSSFTIVSVCTYGKDDSLTFQTSGLLQLSDVIFRHSFLLIIFVLQTLTSFFAERHRITILVKFEISCRCSNQDFRPFFSEISILYGDLDALLRCKGVRSSSGSLRTVSNLERRDWLTRYFPTSEIILSGNGFLISSEKAETVGVSLLTR